MNFLTSGSYQIGYVLEGHKYWLSKHYRNIAVGSFCVTYGYKAILNFKTNLDSEGYFIRRKNWIKIVHVVPTNPIHDIILKTFKD